MLVTSNGVPRRNRLDLNTAAEAKIREAIEAVEALGADPLLTNAVTHLFGAKNQLGDYIDKQLEESYTIG